MIKNREIIFGVHSILELLNAKKRKIYTLYTTKPEPKNFDKIKKLLPKYTQIQFVNKQQLNKLCGTEDHQSIAASVAPFIIRKKFFNPEKEKFLLMLDSIQDPRNLGAILRSAYCTGVDGVIITAKKSSGITATSIKSSAGLAEHLDIFVANTAKEATLLLKENGYKIYISSLQKAKSVEDIKFNLPLCVVIGSEGFGVSKEILKDGITIKLPQKTSDISYNASVAAGILLYKIGTQNKII